MTLVAAYVLRRPDGGEITVVIVEHEDTLDKADEVILGTELLHGEDPRCCPAPIASSGIRSCTPARRRPPPLSRAPDRRPLDCPVPTG